MKQILDATHKEKTDLYARLVEVALQWAKDNDISGLSAVGGWNVYRGLEKTAFHPEEFK